MLLAQLNLFSSDPDSAAIRPGQPFLMTSTGEWRRFDLARYGFNSEPYGELSMAIRPTAARSRLPTRPRLSS